MKSILTFAVLCFALSSFGQVDFDKRLLSKYSADQIEEMSKNHPRALEYWTYYLDNSHEVIDLPSGKDYSQSPEVKIKNIKNFNILDLDVYMMGQSHQVFRIKGTNKLLVLYSKDKFVKLFNENSKI